MTFYVAVFRAYVLAFYLTYILAFYLANILAYVLLAYIFAFGLVVEVQLCTLRSDPGGRGIGANCDPELAKRMNEKLGAEDWRGGEGEEGGVVLIKSSNPHLAAGEKGANTS